MTETWDPCVMIFEGLLVIGRIVRCDACHSRNVQFPFFLYFLFKGLLQTLPSVLGVQAATAQAPGVHLPGLGYVLHGNGHECVRLQLCLSTDPLCRHKMFFL